MKKKLKYILVIILFLLIMLSILYYFYLKRSDIRLLNKAKSLLKYSYNLKEGDYTFSDGIIFSNDTNYVSDEFKIKGKGNINVDKYGNVKFYINTSDYCINKTSVGKIELLDEKCDGFEIINVKAIKNNSKISFTSLYEELEYKISNKDDFSGEWIKEDYSGNLIINTYREGINYIWFKDLKGNISDTLTFEVDCLKTNNAPYDEKILYCSGSTIKIDDIDWVVVEDKKSSITLMTKETVGEELAHCMSYKSEYCFRTNEEKNDYKWSNSYINYYLNNIFINKLSKDTISHLKTSYICDDYDNNSCDGEGCLGYRKEIIDNNNYSCNNYATSLIRLIDFNEYNYIYSKIGESSNLSGKYWIMNSFNTNKASIIDNDFEVFVLEDPLSGNEVRPLIILNKNN